MDTENKITLPYVTDWIITSLFLNIIILKYCVSSEFSYYSLETLRDESLKNFDYKVKTT